MYLDFDQLHVISDLHLGGATLREQTFKQGTTLALLVQLLKASQSPKLGLVLNGDIVDFLGEDTPEYFDATGAIRKLERIFQNPTFLPIWSAFKQFVSTPNRYLILVLGNHDVELALPTVRERLLTELCGEDSSARGRVIFAMDGAGFACTVGSRRVLCLHGNEVDTWNVVDYRSLLEVTRAINRNKPIPEWTPNAGTKLVVDIMNPVKKEHPFVDLLKPEVETVPAMVLAIDNSQAGKILRFWSVALSYARDAVRISTGFLSAENEPAEALDNETAALEYLYKPFRATPEFEKDKITELLDRTQEHIDRGTKAVDLANDFSDETLGVAGLLFDALLDRDEKENLRQTLLEWLDSDKSFKIDHKDKTFKQLDEAVGPDVDFIIAGHTHLERAIKRERYNGVYFNSGTWMRLIRLTTEKLAEEKFDACYEALKAGSMEALDANSDLVTNLATVVSITRQTDGSTVGELNHVHVKNKKAKLKPVPKSRMLP